MIFSNNNNKRTKKEENPGNLQLLLLKAIGFPGDSWALWDTLAGCSRKNCCTGPPCWGGSSMHRCSTRPELSESFHQPLGRSCEPNGVKTRGKISSGYLHLFLRSPIVIWYCVCFSLSANSCFSKGKKKKAQKNIIT